MPLVPSLKLKCNLNQPTDRHSSTQSYAFSHILNFSNPLERYQSTFFSDLLTFFTWFKAEERDHHRVQWIGVGGGGDGGWV